MSTIGLVVPVFNEAERLEEYAEILVSFVERLGQEARLCFVDDGSTDTTAAALTRWADHEQVRVVRRPHAGKGAAVVTGIGLLDNDVIAFCDLDLSTPLDDLATVMALAARAPLLAIGSRDVTGSRIDAAESPVRETLGRLYNRLLQATVTPGVVDTQCGAKAARREVWQAILAHTSEPGFAWDAEVVTVAIALRIPVREVPVAWRHDDRSHVNVGV
ncbi:MAG: glycosyltransferase, partial [Acidimicrobiales bacterium]